MIMWMTTLVSCILKTKWSVRAGGSGGLLLRKRAEGRAMGWEAEDSGFHDHGKCMQSWRTPVLLPTEHLFSLTVEVSAALSLWLPGPEALLIKQPHLLWIRSKWLIPAILLESSLPGVQVSWGIIWRMRPHCRVLMAVSWTDCPLVPTSMHLQSFLIPGIFLILSCLLFLHFCEVFHCLSMFFLFLTSYSQSEFLLLAANTPWLT